MLCNNPSALAKRETISPWFPGHVSYSQNVRAPRMRIARMPNGPYNFELFDGHPDFLDRYDGSDRAVSITIAS